jgi:pantothenate kinase
MGIYKMNKQTASFDHLCSMLTSLPRKHSTLIVAIDAPGGSGKSIFTRALAKRLSQLFSEKNILDAFTTNFATER